MTPPFVARFAANPIAYLVLAIIVAVIGGIIVGITTAVTKRKLVLIGLPLVLAPLAIWLHEWKTDHAWFRAELVAHGTLGALTIYGEEASSEVINGRRVMDELAMIQPATGAAIKVRFHDFFSLSCQDGDLASRLARGPIYSVRFDPDDPDHFCVEQTAEAQARATECPKLASDLAEQLARVRLAPADAAAQQAMTALEAQYAARCTPQP